MLAESFKLLRLTYDINRFFAILAAISEIICTFAFVS